MNQKRDLIQILIFQLLTVPAVIFIFKFIEPRQIAALLASFTFISFGVFGLFKITKWPAFKWDILFWLFCIHLLVISLPTLFVRLLNWSSDFATLHIFGIPAPIFHKLSERFAMIMMVVVLIKIYRLRSPKAG